jgi:hypothetical protein
LTDGTNGGESFTVTVTAVTGWSNATALASGNINSYLATRTATYWIGNTAGIGPNAGTAGVFDTAGEALVLTFDLSNLSAAHQASFALANFTLVNSTGSTYLWDWAVINTASNRLTDFSTAQSSTVAQDVMGLGASPRIGNGDKFILAASANNGGAKLATIIFDLFKGTQWQLVKPTYGTNDAAVVADFPAVTFIPSKWS